MDKLIYRQSYNWLSDMGTGQENEIGIMADRDPARLILLICSTDPRKRKRGLRRLAVTMRSTVAEVEARRG